jgi:hypothetical protein
MALHLETCRAGVLTALISKVRRNRREIEWESLGVTGSILAMTSVKREKEEL